MKITSEKAGFHENWWKSLWFHLMQTDHNLCKKSLLDQFLTFKIWGTKAESPPKWYKRLKFLDSDPDKKALQSTHDMIDHCIDVFAVVVVLTCVMWCLQWLYTVSIIAQVIIEMHMLLLVKDCIISRYNHHARVTIARALNFKVAASHFVKYLWGSDKSNSRKLNCEEHGRY